MIKFSIENGNKETQVEIKLGLRLEGGVAKLVILNERGAVEWYVLRINPDGTLLRNVCLPRGTGLQLGKGGMIKETFEYDN